MRRINKKNDECLQILADTNSGYDKAIAIVGTEEILATEGYYIAEIYVTSNIVVGAQEDIEGVTNLDLTALTEGIPAGSKVYGKWASITLTDGQAIGYQIYDASLYVEEE